MKRDRVPTVQHPHRVRALTSSKMRTTRADANGVVVNRCNPKIGAFFAAFLPGFTPARTSVPGLSLHYGLWFPGETGLWMGAVVVMFSRGMGWFGHSSCSDGWNLSPGSCWSLSGFALD